MVSLAVTGCIGSGKSTVTRELAVLSGGIVCDTDAVCRELLQKGCEGWKGVQSTWGSYYFSADGTIDRQKLREAIFTDAHVRTQLENILHPLVRHHVIRKSQEIIASGGLLIVEVPLLFEVGWQKDFSCTITVFADREICIKRVMSRDGVTREQVVKALDAQMDIKEKIRLSDFSIDNSGDKDDTVSRVAALFENLQGQCLDSSNG